MSEGNYYMMTFPEQLARLARDLPAMEYGSNAWRAIRAYFPGAVGMDESEHVCQCIAKLREENAKLRAILEDVNTQASATLNNGFPDEAPDALAGICKVAGDALKL